MSPTVNEHLGCFHVLAITNYASYKYTFFEHEYPFLLSGYLEVDFLSHLVCVFSALLDAFSFLKWLSQFIFLIAICESFSYCISLPVIAIVCLYFSFWWVLEYLIPGIICIFLITTVLWKGHICKATSKCGRSWETKKGGRQIQFVGFGWLTRGS